MANSKLLLTLTGLLAMNAYAEIKMDKKETINGVMVKTGKSHSTRAYSGFVTKIFPFKLETVKNSVVNFDEKCNNSFKDRRKYTDQKKECKYHNDNLVETIIVKDLKPAGQNKETNETERYILGRQIYNRGSFGYYELVHVYEYKNDKNQKTIKIVQKMLSDKEVKKYINPKFEKDSAFDDSTASYILTEISPNETSFDYEYKANTEHWILNKEVSVPQVFSSISKSINDLVKTVQAESTALNRDLASN